MCSAFPSTPFKFACFTIFRVLLYASFASQTSGLCSVIPSVPFSLHALLYAVMFLYKCFASQKSGLCSAIPSVPFSLHALLYAVVFLYASFASQTSGLCSVIPSTHFSLHALLYSRCFCTRPLPQKHRVCTLLFLRLTLVCMLCYIQSNFLECVVCHTNIEFVQCYSLGSFLNLENIIFQVVVVERFHSITPSLPVRHLEPGGGDYQMRRQGMLVGKYEFNSQRRLMWTLLQLH